MQKANSIDAVSHQVALMRLLGYSGIGVVIFFWTVDIGDKSTILLDHITSYLDNLIHFGLSVPDDMQALVADMRAGARKS